MGRIVLVRLHWGAPVHPKVHFGFQTILAAILIQFTSNLEYSLGMDIGRSLLILVHEDTQGLQLCIKSCTLVSRHSLQIRNVVWVWVREEPY